MSFRSSVTAKKLTFCYGSVPLWTTDFFLYVGLTYISTSSFQEYHSKTGQGFPFLSKQSNIPLDILILVQVGVGTLIMLITQLYSDAASQSPLLTCRLCHSTMTVGTEMYRSAVSYAGGVHEFVLLKANSDLSPATSAERARKIRISVSKQQFRLIVA